MYLRLLPSRSIDNGMNRIAIARYREALAETFAAGSRWPFHVTIELHPRASRQMLVEAVRFWVARVDRFYLGRNWVRLGDRRMDGVVFFEKRPHHHAHMILRPPVGASHLHFLLNGRFFFEAHPALELRRCFPRPAVHGPKMMIQKIGESAADRQRVIKYDSKALEFDPSAAADWTFLRDLTG